MAVTLSARAHLLLAIATAQTGKYVFVDQKLNFADAQAYCESEYQSDLASIHSEADNTAATNLCRDSVASETTDTTKWLCLIGLNDIDVEDTFVWQDDTTFDYGGDTSGGQGPWGGGIGSGYPQPNNFDGGEDCVIFNGAVYDYLWADVTCDGPGATFYFICNANPSVPPTQQPSHVPSESTHSPTKNPTNHPTTSPSLYPSAGPTSPPSIPLTRQPSDQLSYAPIVATTEPQSPTTIVPGEHGDNEGEYEHENENADEDDSQAGNPNAASNDTSPPINYALVFGCIGAVIVCAALFCCVIGFVYRRNALAAKEHHENIKFTDDLSKRKADDRANPGLQSASRKQVRAEPLRNDLYTVVDVTAGGEQGNDHAVQPLNAQVDRMAVANNIQRFCDDAQHDEEVVGDDEIEFATTTRGAAQDLRHAPVKDVSRFCDDALNDEEVVGDDEDDGELEYGHTTKGMQERPWKNQQGTKRPNQSEDDQVDGYGPEL